MVSMVANCNDARKREPATDCPTQKGPKAFVPPSRGVVFLLGLVCRTA